MKSWIGFQEIRIFPTRLRNDGSQLCKAQCSHQWDTSTCCPDYKCESNTSRVFERCGGCQKYTGTNDSTDDDVDRSQQTNGSFWSTNLNGCISLCTLKITIKTIRIMFVNGLITNCLAASIKNIYVALFFLKYGSILFLIPKSIKNIKAPNNSYPWKFDFVNFKYDFGPMPLNLPIFNQCVRKQLVRKYNTLLLHHCQIKRIMLKWAP